MTASTVVRMRVLATTLLVLLVLAGTAHAGVVVSGEGTSGITASGVGSLHAHVASTSGIVYTATFDFGTTTAYGQSIAGTTGVQNVTANFNGTITSVAVTGLSCGTTYHWRLTVVSAVSGSDQTLTTSPCTSVSPASKDFGSVATGGSGGQTFTISNLSGSSITVSAISFVGADAAMFGVATGTCASLTPTIAASGSCTVNVLFMPSSAGAKSTTLRVASDAPDSPVDVALVGSGTGGSVPTLSEWGMILLGLLFAGFMVISSRRGQGGRAA